MKESFTGVLERSIAACSRGELQIPAISQNRPTAAWSSEKSFEGGKPAYEAEATNAKETKKKKSPSIHTQSIDLEPSKEKS